MNVDAPACLLPATVAHELAHQRSIASEQECNFLAVLASTTSGNPVYAYSGYRRSGVDDLAGTYVEVNLTTQHIWFYVDGQLIVESDLVSGCVSKGTETQTGAFPLATRKVPPC